MTRFDKSLAVITGIDQYENDIRPLYTAVNDANCLAETLKRILAGGAVLGI